MLGSCLEKRKATLGGEDPDTLTSIIILVQTRKYKFVTSSILLVVLVRTENPHKIMTRTQTITFNIGGQRYEISRSLLDQFPETMLTKSASETGLKDESEEIFIERDGYSFSHVLSYMRDSKVVLPVTERKKSFVDELTYYGLEMRDEDIDFDRANLRAISSSLEDFKKDLDCDTKEKKLTSFLCSKLLHRNGNASQQIASEGKQNFQGMNLNS